MISVTRSCCDKCDKVSEQFSHEVFEIGVCLLRPADEFPVWLALRMHEWLKIDQAHHNSPRKAPNPGGQRLSLMHVFHWTSGTDHVRFPVEETWCFRLAKPLTPCQCCGLAESDSECKSFTGCHMRDSSTKVPSNAWYTRGLEKSKS